MIEIEGGSIEIRHNQGQTLSVRQITNELAELESQLEAARASCETPVDSGAPAPESAEQVSKRTADEALAELKAKLQELLTASADWDAAIVAMNAAEKAVTENLRHLWDAEVPHTSDRRQVREVLGKRLALWRKEIECQAAKQTTRLAAYERQSEYHSRYGELNSMLEALEKEFPYLRDHDIVSAARCRYKGGTKNDWAHHPGAVPTWPTEPEYRLGEATARVLNALCAVALARQHLDAYEAAKEAMEAYDASMELWKLKTPVRSALEELHRYIRQITDKLTRRQPYHAACAEAIGRCRAAVSFVDGAGSMDEVLEKLQSLVRTKDVEVAVQAVTYARSCRQIVQKKLESVLEEAPQNLDVGPAREPNASEKVTIARCRQLILEMAMALAKLRESEVSAGVAGNTERAKVDYCGLLGCSGWDEYVAWWDKKMTEQKAVDRANLVLNTKTSLAQDATGHFLENKTVVAGKLRRFLLSNIPNPKHPPCDELRMLLNAVAFVWCSVTRKTSNTGRPGIYPIFGLLSRSDDDDRS